MNAPLKHVNEAATDFARRHIGPSPRDVAAMLETVGAKSLGELMGQTLPSSIRQKTGLERNRGAGAYE
jgi:glycine dehydrogenase